MIALTFALPAESSELLRQLRDKTALTRNGIKTIRGKIANHDIEILHTGVGEKICRGRLEKFLHDARFDFLISSGFAGALHDSWKAGDLVLASNFSDARLTAGAAQILKNQNVRIARMWTSRMMVGSPADRNEIAQTENADAVDMETEFIAQACAARGIRMLSLRTISDTAHQPFPAPPEVLFDIERQRTDPITLLSHLLQHPSAVWRLIRFSRQVANARKKLADAIADLLHSIEW